VTDFEDKLSHVVTQHIDGCVAMKSVERLSGGASQETYRIIIDTADGERPLAMRRAAGGLSREAAAGIRVERPGLAVEALLMGEARRAGVPAPEVYYVLSGEDGLGDGFIMSWLEGEALGTRILRDDQYAKIRPTLARECGRILGRIHSIDIVQTGLSERLPHTPPEEFVMQTWERYQMLDVPQPMVDYAGRWLMDNVPQDFKMALVHNDFRNGNFMVTSDAIVGVLDWEIAHIGDPMRDLGWICTNAWRFGESLPVGGFGPYEDLFSGYEEVTGEPVDADRVHYWEVFGSFWWSVTCLFMAQQFRSGPDRSVERAMIGRRTSEGQVDCANLLMPGDTVMLEPAATPASLEMPRDDELLVATSEFLREVVMNETTGRTRFLARVAANVTDVLSREKDLLAAHRAAELADLQAIYDSKEDLLTLRWRLVKALREGIQPLDAPGLKTYLRHFTVNQIAIDNPKYSGLRQAQSYAAGA
jgi:aminoglycoside phosphotransferase (APT) family kinase protein